MAKSKVKPAEEKIQPEVEVVPALAEILRSYLPVMRNDGSLLIDAPIKMTLAQFNTERYSTEFFKLIKSSAPATPLIIIQEEDQPVSQLGWFDALDTGLWYNLIAVPKTVLDDLV